jgi:hypothetical protein
MANGGKVDYRQLRKFQKKLQTQLSGEQLDKFIESCAKAVAARLLAVVVEKTPTGIYSGESYVCVRKLTHNGNKVVGKVGGTLKRGWTGGKKQDITSFAESLQVQHRGDTYVIEIMNPVEYASYVEFGHRTRNGGGVGWVEGHFMLRDSEIQLLREAPRALERKLKRKLGECFK